jgi:hypothetical protein
LHTLQEREDNLTFMFNMRSTLGRNTTSYTNKNTQTQPKQEKNLAHLWRTSVPQLPKELLKTDHKNPSNTNLRRVDGCKRKD